MTNNDYTRPVLTGEELNIEKLTSILFKNNLIADPHEHLEVRQFSNGFSNLTYLIKASTQEYVLRMPPRGAIKRGHDMSREYKVLSNLSKGWDRSPKAYVYSEDASLLGASFYIMEKVDGVILNYKNAKDLDIAPVDFKTISNTWLDALVEFHQLDYKSVGLADLGRPEGYVVRQVTNWSKQYVKASTKDVPAAQKLMGWLEANQPKEYQSSIIHNDFKYDNVVFKDTEWNEISAILDWEMCTLGDPYMDLGTSLAYWTTSNDPDMFVKGLSSPTSLPGNPSRMELVEMYSQKSGKDVDNLVFYYAFGLFKIAVIVQQIFYRYEQGLTKDPKFANLDVVGELLCNVALQSVSKKRIDDLF